jgi:hypothetical protein
MPELDLTTLSFLGGLALAALILLIAAAVRRSARRRLETLGPAFELGTARVPGALSSAVEGIFHGYTCRYSTEQRSQYSPGGATLRIFASSPQQWMASKQDVGSRLMTQIGLLRDVTIGDAELDRRLRFSGADATGLMNVFGQERAREALRSLAATESFASVAVRGRRVDIKWAPRNPALDDDPDALRQRMMASVDLLTACGIPPAMG